MGWTGRQSTDAAYAGPSADRRRAKIDVRQSLNRVKASPFIPNKASVRGFVYEVETGRLREVV